MSGLVIALIISAPPFAVGVTVVALVIASTRLNHKREDGQ